MHTSPQASNRKNILNPILLFLFILLIYSLSIHQIVDNDIFLHIKSGEYMLENKTVLSEDVFSYTIEGKPWLNSQWLAQIIFYIIYSLFNFNGLIIFKATIICAAFLIMLFTFLKRNEYSWLYFLIAAFAVISSSGRFIERPENFTLLFVSVYLYIFNKRKELLWLIPIIQMLWVNIHGGFIVGLLLTLLFVIGEILEAKIPYFKTDLPENKSQKLRSRVILLAAVFFACFINPFGYKIILNTFQFAQNKILQKFILEWLPPFVNFSLNRQDIMAAFLCLIIISIACLILNFRKARPFHVLCLLTFLYLGISGRRNIALFAIVSSVFIGLTITQIINSSFPNLRKVLLKSRPIISACLVSLLCVLIFLVVTNIYFTQIEVPQDFGLGISSALEPIGASDFIKENNIKGKLFNDYDFGGYLIYALYPKQKVFIDGRIDTYGWDFYLNEYTPFFSGNNEILKQAINKYDINLFVLKMGKENPFVPSLLKNYVYRLIYFDRSSLIIIKNSLENKELIARYAIDTSDTEELERHALKLTMRSPHSYGLNSLSKLLDGLVKNRRFPMAEYHLGAFYSGLGDFELAKQQFEKGIEMLPGYKIMRYELGNLYFRNGKLDEAIDAYSQVLKYDKKDYKVFKVLGDIYIAKNDFVNAALEYERSIKIKPYYDIGIYKTLSTIYKFYLNNNEKAQEYYQKYLQLAKDTKEKQDAEDLINSR